METIIPSQTLPWKFPPGMATKIHAAQESVEYIPKKGKFGEKEGAPPPKPGEKSKAKYRFAAAEDSIGVLRDALHAQRLFLTGKDIDLIQTEKGFWVGVFTFHLVDGDTGDVYPISRKWPIVPTDFRPIDKATAAADTHCLNYLCRDLLNIPREEEVENRDDTQRPSAPSIAPPPGIRPPPRARAVAAPEETQEAPVEAPTQPAPTEAPDEPPAAPPAPKSSRQEALERYLRLFDEVDIGTTLDTTRQLIAYCFLLMCHNLTPTERASEEQIMAAAAKWEERKGENTILHELYAKAVAINKLAPDAVPEAFRTKPAETTRRCGTDPALHDRTVLLFKDMKAAREKAGLTPEEWRPLINTWAGTTISTESGINIDGLTETQVGSLVTGFSSWYETRFGTSAKS